MYLEIVKK